MVWRDHKTTLPPCKERYEIFWGMLKMTHTSLWWAFLLILQLYVHTILPRKPITWLIHAKMDCKPVYIRKRSQTSGFPLTISAEPCPFLGKIILPFRESLAQSWEWNNSGTISLVQTTCWTDYNPLSPIYNNRQRATSKRLDIFSETGHYKFLIFCMMVEGNMEHHLSKVPYLGKNLIRGLRGIKCQKFGFLDIFSETAH